MSLKQLLILFVILFFLPAILGKVSLQPFANFFSHISWDNFVAAFTSVFQADITFYTGLIWPWIQKLINLIKGSLSKGALGL